MNKIDKADEAQLLATIDRWIELLVEQRNQVLALLPPVNNP